MESTPSPVRFLLQLPWGASSNKKMAETTKFECGFTGCGYVSENADKEVAKLQFQSHMSFHTQPQAKAATSKQKLPPVARPECRQDITMEEWDSFCREFRRFKRNTDYPAGGEADQLFDCCEKALQRLLLKENPNIIEAGETELLSAIKRMAVIRVPTSVRRTNLLALRQDHGQKIREFYADVKAQAATCGFKVKCSEECCKKTEIKDDVLVDYTQLVIKDILIFGVADPDIRRDVLELPDLDEKSASDLVGFIEGKETAKKAWANQSIDVGSNSSYKKQNNKLPDEPELNKKLELKGSCANCSKQISLYKRGYGGRLNKTPFKLCLKCHKETVGPDKQKPKEQKPQSEQAAIHGFISAITTKTDPQIADDTSASPQQKEEMTNMCCEVVLDHHIFTKDGWDKATSLSHPVLRLRISTDVEDYSKMNLKPVAVAPKHIDVVADTGAQSCLWSRRDFLRSGFNLKDLIKVHHTLEAANTAPINIDGAILLRLSGIDNKNGREIQAKVMVYVSPDSKQFYLSREAMVQLGIINQDFPQVGAALPLNLECNSVGVKPLNKVCDCEERSLPPGKPDKLPFDAIPENVEKMKAYLLDRYKGSTFNKCKHCPLPEMTGPPMKFHIDPEAKPVAFRKPVPVPLCWQEQVETELNDDVTIGVLERVPHGEATEWCFRMVLDRKSNGDPRRTVDLSPLNKFCKREVHVSKSPFQQARSVPPNSYKTVFDHWNGFHSVPIRKEDRHFTTFTTPWGLFRYKRAPQGYLSSGDGFSRRLDDITAEVVRLERCVDDSLIHDTSMEDHWWRAIEYLEISGNNGIVINPEKFQFCQPIVDFAGFRISSDSVEPLPKYLNAIKQFPTPQTTTDIKSWFGLVNQVAHYGQLRKMLEPFRPFLSPKVPFEWNTQLDTAFTDSKNAIVAAIKEGVKIFDITRRTCLLTDWSKSGIGYFLTQKHCECESGSFGCCDDGWKITLAGSRFLTKSEENYVPVVGEALAVTWALEQTKFFTMGCDNLLLVVDHKPLVRIFGDRRLDEIENDQLYRLKRKTLRWRFEIEYQPGKIHFLADAVSRNPSKSDVDTLEVSTTVAGMTQVDKRSVMASIFDDVDKFVAVTMERVESESQSDAEISLLSTVVNNGFPNSKKEMPSEIAEYWEFRSGLSTVGNVVMYMGRVVIPTRLRARVIENLHSAHQGTSGMYLRAKASVFWPGMTADIQDAREECRTCHRNAPSKAATAPIERETPKVPFEMLYSDYFKLKGHWYLIIGDRLSGWTEIYRNADTGSGARGLCNSLRRVFSTFGVPRDLSSDQGPEFTAMETKDFLERWGVKHTLSSAYFPQSNGRAEVAVRITKRLLEENMGVDGSIDNDNVVRALLQLRNTPDKDCKMSPAEVLFGRTLKDSLPLLDKSMSVFESPQIHPNWHEAWEAKEMAIRTRMVKTCERLEQSSKELSPLREGDTVLIQNQNGPNPDWGK